MTVQLISRAAVVIALDEKALVPEHPSVGADLNNLAELWVRHPVLAEGALK